MDPAEETLDDTKTSEPPNVDSQQFDLVLLHPFQNSFPGFHPRIEMQQFRPIRYFTSWRCHVRTAFFVHVSFVREPPDAPPQCIHVGELEDVSHHDDLVV